MMLDKDTYRLMFTIIHSNLMPICDQIIWKDLIDKRDLAYSRAEYDFEEFILASQELDNFIQKFVSENISL